MSFTMPQFEILQGDEVNPLAGVLNKGASVSQNLTKAKYAPMTMQADAMSKMAYANLMAPQFLAKLMGNPDIVANMSEEQKRQALGFVTSAGMGQGTGNGLLSMISQLFRGGSQGQSPQQSGGAQSTIDTSNQQPSPQAQEQAPQQNPAEQTTPTNAYAYDTNGNNLRGSDEDIQNAINRSNGSGGQQPNWSEKAGIAAGQKAQGEEAGKLRAQDVKELGDAYMDQKADLANLDLMGKTLNDPELEKIKNFPVKGHYELAYYAGFGTPKQKELIGNLRSTLKNSIASGSQQFKGQFRQGEQTLLTSGYPSEDDTLDTMKGKWESTETLKRMINQRTKIMMDMENKGIDKATASDIADKMVDGDKIRDALHKTIYSRTKPTDEDINFMMQKYGIPKEEVMKRLVKKGIM